MNSTERYRQRWVRRLRHHVALGAGSVVGGVAVVAALDSTDERFRLSMATAYVGLALLAVTLAFGPIAALRGKRYPASTDLRRDIGIWAALAAIAHVCIGLQVHLRGKMWQYFVRSIKGTLLPRIDPFGAANYAGLLAALLLALLLLTSNDASLRRLGVARWRRIHESIEWALVLTLLHGALYQWIERRGSGFVVVLGIVAGAVILIRVGGKRRRESQEMPNPGSS